MRSGSAISGSGASGYARLRFAEKGILSIGLPLIAALGLSGRWKARETLRIVKLLRDTAAKILADLDAAHANGLPLSTRARPK